MSSNIASHEETKATRLMRRAILHELYCSHGPNDGSDVQWGRPRGELPKP